MKAIFVTGTGTGVGKSVVTGCLARFLSERGSNVITQKWIQTGLTGSSFVSDLDLHLKIMRRDKKEILEYLPYAAPYIFKAACSPHLASRLENKTINPGKIVRSFKFLSGKFDFVIVEGIGGALVPFNNKHSVIDIARELKLDVLIVAENKLGAINHTLLTIEAFVKRKMRVLGVVFNNCKGEQKKIIEDNPRIIRALSGQKILGVLPWIKWDGDSGISKLYKGFIPIGNRLINGLRNG